ncbi:hypothetical protein SLS53_005198 [Cytospora paraplurivora]|uniref:Uncharacterized protein n=1 Tax=Cytospora paraplurivora TaxID=2898453 RepID=A0AAN9U8U4_9PEZI
MVGSSGHRILSRVRSNRKLRTTTAAELEEQKLSIHRRQHSDNVSASVTGSSAMPISDARTHRPPIEWDPLKLNPPTPPVARPRDSVPEYTLRSKRSFAGAGHRPRMHHSDSGFSLEVHEGFDFGFEREKALARMERDQHQHRHHHHHHHDDDDDNDDDDQSKGWPSPTSSVDSDKSWFDHGGDDNDHGDEDGAVKRINDLWGDAPSARRRPQVASPDDPNYFIQRGGWKRRGIVFGGTADQTRQKDEEVFNII